MFPYILKFVKIPRNCECQASSITYSPHICLVHKNCTLYPFDLSPLIFTSVPIVMGHVLANIIVIFCLITEPILHPLEHLFRIHFVAFGIHDHRQSVGLENGFIVVDCAIGGGHFSVQGIVARILFAILPIGNRLIGAFILVVIPRGWGVESVRVAPRDPLFPAQILRNDTVHLNRLDANRSRPRGELGDYRLTGVIELGGYGAAG
ncbi:hypothetical protein HRbin15_01858 [bacterium HR15]|nr:hypothetical protein HRbin15_01858 [bacterium HR15]